MKKPSIQKENSFVGPALVWKRIVAFFIDISLVLAVLSIPFRKLLKDALPKGFSFSEMLQLMEQDAALTGYLISVYLAMSALAFMYFYLLEKKMSQTIGKRIMNIYVVSDIGQMRRWQLLVRNLFLVPVFPFDLLFIVDPLFMIFTKSNQRLTEILSKTRVVGKYSIEQ